MTNAAALLERLDSNSIPLTECGCIIWLGAMSARRYGVIKIDGQQIKTHRASWFANFGPVPKGLNILHKCDVPLCINPDHLFIGTPLDNARDKEAKGRGNHATGMRSGRYTKPHRTSRGDHHYTRRIPGLKRGEGNGRAKLTAKQVLEIREWNGSTLACGLKYGITKTTVLKIKHRKLWGHL